MHIKPYSLYGTKQKLIIITFMTLPLFTTGSNFKLRKKKTTSFFTRSSRPGGSNFKLKRSSSSFTRSRTSHIDAYTCIEMGSSIVVLQMSLTHWFRFEPK